MSEPYIGEIRLFPIRYAPKGWVPCNGQTLSIMGNQALYSLIGNTYGGNGVSTFNLPDLRGRVPIHQSSDFRYGTSGGAEQHTLTITEMPAHTHQVLASSGNATQSDPSHCVWAKTIGELYTDGEPNVTMNVEAIEAAGNSEAHTNMQPYLGVQFCIAVQGQYPTRN